MRSRVFVILLLGAGIAAAQELPDAPISKATWTTFAGLGAEIVADSVTTRILYQRRYDELNPLVKPFVHAGVPGQAGGSLLGAAAVGGVWLMLRRTHHDRAAAWFLRSVAAGEGGNVARQFMILRTSRNGNDPSGSGPSQPEPMRRHRTHALALNVRGADVL
jgi:hypothetical protein